MRDRGVVDVREGDMFALRDAFERDRFASALAIGTQIGLAGSMRGALGISRRPRVRDDARRDGRDRFLRPGSPRSR